MLMDYFDQYDNEILAEIDGDVYHKFLQTLDGQELAEAVDGSIIVHDDDPRRSALDNTDVFFSYVSVASGVNKADELLDEYKKTF